MNEKTYIGIDDEWMTLACLEHNITSENLKSPPPKANNFNVNSSWTRSDLDLSYVIGSSLFDLLNLFLLIDHIQATSNPVHIKLPISYLHDTLWEGIYYTLEEYNKLKAGKQFLKLPKADREKYDRSNKVYKFLSFCYNFGFFDALGYLRSAQKVIFDGCNIDKHFLSNLYEYRGSIETGSKIFGLLPIRNSDDTYSFRDGNIIENWILNLPEQLREFPIFKDGEFSRVFGYQLAMNVNEHSGVDITGEYGSQGAIAMRILPPDLDNNIWLYKSFPEELLTVYNSTGNSKGVLEICVGDRGCGISDTLTDSLRKYHSKFGFKSQITNLKTLFFAFDELGSSKPINKRIGGVHALHRIFKCVSKYNGAMRVRSNGNEIIYNLTSSGGAERRADNLGIYTDNVKEIIHPYGVQIQILLPLVVPSRKTSLHISRMAKYAMRPDSQIKSRIIPLRAYYQKDIGGSIDLNLLGSLSSELMEEPARKSLVFDFAGNDWIEEDFAVILHSIKSVLHTHKCIGINLDSGIARLVREKEIFDGQTVASGEMQISRFFDVLSSKHRLFPVFDRKDKVWWFGLGRYDLDEILNRIFYSGKISDSEISPNHLDTLKIYYSVNRDYLLYGDQNSWQSNIDLPEYKKYLSNAVRTSFINSAEEHGCLKSDGLYKLPSRKDFAKQFFQSTALFQDNNISRQLGEWGAYAVRTKIEKSEDTELLLVCTTAPSELFAKAILDSLRNVKCDIVNLGHYSSLDPGEILKKGGWNCPVFIITDVIDRQKTVRQVYSRVMAHNLAIYGVVSLVIFKDNIDLDDSNDCFNWLKFPIGECDVVDIFYISEFKRPESVDDVKVINKDYEFLCEKLFYVEPFSLEIFKYESLSKSQYIFSRKYEKNKRRLAAIEDVNAVRSGHWVYGDHHFLISTSIKTMLEDDRIGGEICHEIVSVCIENKIDHILLPLHSQISVILPRITSSLKISAGLDIDYSLCLSTRVLTEQSFYVLPNKVKNLIKNSNDSGPGLRLLIIDDAVASGRTLETILRSLIVESRKTNLENSPIDYVHVYSILDRQGRARGTQLTGIKTLNMHGDGEAPISNANDYNFDFNFERWIDIDMPVDDKETCVLCSELNDLTAIIKNLKNVHPENSLIEILKWRINKISPLFLDTPLFEDYLPKRLPWVVEIGQISATTVEMALWEFYNLRYRGCPILYFLKWLSCFDKYKNGREDCDFDKMALNNLLELKVTIIRTLLRDWKRLASQWVGELFERYLLLELEKYPEMAEEIFSEAGRSLSFANAANSILRGIFSYGLRKVLLTKEEDDSDFLIRHTYANSCKIFLIFHNYYNNISGSYRDFTAASRMNVPMLIEEIYDYTGKTEFSKYVIPEILSYYKGKYFEIDFISIFIDVLTETVRPGRKVHPHLLINHLSMFRREKDLISISISERKIVKDRILKFIHSFDKVIEYFPDLLSPRNLLVYNEFKSKCEVFQKQLRNTDINWPNKSDTPESIRANAAYIMIHFPYQIANPLYRSLCETQLSIIEIENYITQGCQARNYKVNYSIDPSLRDLYVMVPNKKRALDGIFHNFTIGVKRDTTFCSDPQIFISITENAGSGNGRITFIIYSNLQPFENIRISTGPAAREIGGQAYKLFDIKLDHDTVEEVIDGVNYNVKILLTFFKGVKVK